MINTDNNASPSSEETSWEDPRSARQLQLGANVEFITTFGVRHIGITARSSETPDHFRPVGYGLPVSSIPVLFKSESTENPEYFSPHQVEKYRKTKETVPKKRLISVTNGNTQASTGILSPLFSAYFILRYYDKVSRFPSLADCTFSTSHYSNEDGKDQWETHIWLGGSFNIELTEISGENAITVLAKNQKHAQLDKTYDFHQVAQAAEDVLRFLMME